MFRSLRSRLIAAFLAVALVAVALLAFLSFRVTSAQFGSYLFQGRMMFGQRIFAALGSYYQSRGSWTGIELQIGQLAEQLGNRIALYDTAGNLVAEADHRPPGLRGGMMPMMGGRNRLPRMRQPLVIDGKTVGLLAWTPPTIPEGTTGPEQAFLMATQRYVWLAALIVGVLAVAFGLILSERMAGPVRRLTEAAHAMADGRLGQKVEVHASEEVEELAGAFNKMSENLQRVEELRRNMVADVAHELRTPVATMQAQLEGMIDGVIPGAPEDLRAVHEETVTLSRLIDQLRELSLAEAGELQLSVEELDICDVVRKEIDAARPEYEAGAVELVRDCPRSLPHVRADHLRIGQVLRNLLSNALRHTPARGTVTVTAEVTMEPGGEPGGRAHTGEGAGSSGPGGVPRGIEVSVRDTGSGIAPEDLPFVFERFYRADKSRAREVDEGAGFAGGLGGGGFGIGLTISKRLVEAHGGRIWAESTPGEGTAMKFWVPLPQCESTRGLL